MTIESRGAVPFQLQFDKPITSQDILPKLNLEREKDLLALVMENSKFLLHRFNWQRLCITSVGKCITSICWRPNGKAIAVGLEDGAVLLHGVEELSSTRWLSKLLMWSILLKSSGHHFLS